MLITLLFSTPLLALEKTAPATATDPFAAAYVFKLIAVMGFILVLIFALAWMMKKMQLNPNARNGLIQIISAISVGQRDRIALIQVGDEQILVGLSPGRIEKLHHLETPLVAQQKTATAVSFSDRFQQLMNRDRHHADS